MSHLQAGDGPVTYGFALGSTGHHLKTISRGCMQQHCQSKTLTLQSCGTAPSVVNAGQLWKDGNLLLQTGSPERTRR